MEQLKTKIDQHSIYQEWYLILMKLCSILEKINWKYWWGLAVDNPLKKSYLRETISLLASILLLMRPLCNYWSFFLWKHAQYSLALLWAFLLSLDTPAKASIEIHLATSHGVKTGHLQCVCFLVLITRSITDNPLGKVQDSRSWYSGDARDEDTAQGSPRWHGPRSRMGCLFQSSEAQKG